MRNPGRSSHSLLLAALGGLLFILARSSSSSYAVFTDTESTRLRFEAGSWGGCVQSMGYWKNHPEAWPVGEISLGNLSYSKEAALDILGAPPKGDAWYVLARELIAAKLNLASGAGGLVINEAIHAADAWIAAHAAGSDPDREAREQAIALAQELETYNLGEGDWPPCPDEPLPEVGNPLPEGAADEEQTPGDHAPDGQADGAELAATQPADSENVQNTPEP